MFDFPGKEMFLILKNIILNYFNVLKLKINFKNKKLLFDIFLNKK
jgi:hypothetical protein